MEADLSTDEKLELIRRHIECELQQDWNGALATMAPEPRYIYHPLGLAVSGADAVVAVWERLLTVPGVEEVVTASVDRHFVVGDTIITETQSTGDLGAASSHAGNFYAQWEFTEDRIARETVFLNAQISAVLEPMVDDSLLRLPGVERLAQVELPYRTFTG